jgi:hypothetical protein
MWYNSSKQQARLAEPSAVKAEDEFMEVAISTVAFLSQSL